VADKAPECCIPLHAYFGELAQPVEIWFGIMSRKVLRGASFRDTQELGKAIEAFVKAYKKKAKTFTWRKKRS